MYVGGTDTYLGLVEGEGEGPQWNANLVGLNLAGCTDRWGLTSLTGEEVETRGD